MSGWSNFAFRMSGLAASPSSSALSQRSLMSLYSSLLNSRATLKALHNQA